MSSLILDSFEIHNFRPFRHLKIKRLARVNLIVGKNNVGKTSLLEALHLYGHGGVPAIVIQQLAARDEVSYFTSVKPQGAIEQGYDSVLAIRHLFYGHLNGSQHSIQLGPPNSPNQSLCLTVVDEEPGLSAVGDPVLVVKREGETKRYSLLRHFQGQLPPLTQAGIKSGCLFIPAQGLTNEEMEILWDNIALTDLEREMVSALQIMAPNVQGLNFIMASRRSRVRIPKVKLAKFAKPIALGTMGEGMNRILAIALALVNAKDGMLLIDDVESGFHYSVLTDVLRLIFQMAARLNIQVFVTSHRWECIDAFQIAANENENVEGLLFSLRNKKGKPGEVVAILYEEEELEAIITPSARIEVR